MFHFTGLRSIFTLLLLGTIFLPIACLSQNTEVSELIAEPAEKEPKNLAAFGLPIMNDTILDARGLSMEARGSSAQVMEGLTIDIRDLDKQEYGNHPEFGMFASDGAIELLGKREEHSKTYIFDDGSYRTAKSIYPQHYKDDNGLWITIGDKLVVSPIENQKVGVYNSAYPLEVSLNDMSLEMTLKEDDKLSFGGSKSIEYYDSDFNLLTTQSPMLGSPVWSDSSVTQENIYPQIDKTYQLRGVAMEYLYTIDVIPDAITDVDSGYVVIWENMELGQDVGLDYVNHVTGGIDWMETLSENHAEITMNQINLMKGGEQIGLIDNPYAFQPWDEVEVATAGMDSLELLAYREAYDGSIVLPRVVENTGSGNYRIGIVVPIEWLKANDRSFPVTIDPTISGWNGQYGSVEYNTWGCSENFWIQFPTNSTITAVTSEYWINARNGRWRSDQRSRTEGTNGQTGTQVGCCNSGGWNYYSVGANNILTGTVSGWNQFIWRSYRTYTPQCGGGWWNPSYPCEYCGQVNQRRQNNWTIYVDYCTVQGDQVSYGSNQWIGYVYDNSNFTNYRGYVTQNNAFNQTFGGSTNNYNTNGCPVYMETMSVRYKNQRNFPCGIYRFRLGGDDGHRISIDGGGSWLGEWWYNQGYNWGANHYTPWVFLDGTYDLVMEFYENGGGNRIRVRDYSLTPTISVSINQGSSGTICSNSIASLTATGTTNYGPVNNYSWSGPGGFTGSGATVSGLSQSGTYTVTATHECGQTASDNYVLSIDPAPTVEAGSDISDCYGSGASIPMNNSGTDPSASNASSISWSGGGGSWSGSGLTPNDYSYNTASGTGSFTATLSVTGSGECSGTTATDTRTISWSEVVAEAGTNQSQCTPDPYVINGASASGSYSGLSWSTSVTSGGATFSGTNTINPTITPTTSAGSVTMTLNVSGSGDCVGNNPTDFMTFTWAAGPLADVGTPVNQCGDADVMFTNASASTGSTVSWTVLSGGAGSGTIISGSALDPTTWGFDPTSATGVKTVRLTVTGSGACGGAIATDDLVISWDETPEVTTTSPINTCSGTSPYLITGTSANGTYSALNWSLTQISGTGSITSGGSGASPTFTPTTTNGQYAMVLAATGSGLCTGTNPSASLTLTWENPPVVEAGSTISECEGNSVSMTGASITGGSYSSIFWSQTGGTATGSFTSTHPTDPTLWEFTPTSSGTATFELSVTGQGSICGSLIVTDTRTASWDELPTVEAGTDIDVCTGSNPLTMSGASASNYSSYTWSDGGGFGTWVQGSGIANAEFTPSVVDGQIIALLTVVGTGACATESASDSRTLDWHTPPVITLSITDNTNCFVPNGIINITATGGLAPYQYSDDAGASYQTDFFFDGLSETSPINIQVMDANNCSTAYASNPVTVGGPPAVTTSAIVTQGNICAGAALGEITLSGPYNGSGGDYAYTIEGPSSDRWFSLGTSDPFVIDSLPNGTYDVVVSDLFGCLSSTITVSITSPPPITITSMNITDVIGCGASGTGAIDIVASGGTGTLTYYLDSILNTPATSGLWAGLPGGSYEAMVTDQNQCNTIANATINAPWTVDAGPDIFNCGSGSAALEGGIVGQFPSTCPLVCSSGCGMPGGYCGAQATNTSDEWIDRVIFNTINNTSGSTTYSDFMAQSTTVVRGNTYLMQVRTKKCCGNNSWNECARVYFDWNRNGSFENGNGERYNMGCSQVNQANRTLNITIPAGASLGTTRMRVYHRYNSNPPNNGCGNTTYGEVEDYTVVIEGTTQCTGTFSWSPLGGSSPTASVTPFSNTTYTLTIDDGLGCIQSDDVTVNLSNQAASGSVVNVDCFGSDDGCITINASGGIQPYLIKGPDNEVKVFGGNMKPITITNNVGTTYSNHPAKITVPYSSGMRADFGDVRFYDENLNLIPYWTETYSLSTDATVWLKVPSLMASGTTTVFMTYGNTTISTASDGEAVFDFFDDFNSFDATKWTQGTIAATSGTNWSYYGGALIGGNINRYQQSLATFSGAKIVETRQKGSAVNNNGYTTIGLRVSNNNGASILHHRAGNRVYTRSDAAWMNHESASYMLDEWVRNVIRHSGSLAYYKRYNSAGIDLLNVSRGIGPLSGERVWLGARQDNGAYNQNFSAEWDWTFVRQYIATEPSFTFGSTVTSDNVFCGLSPNTYNITVADVAGCSTSLTETVTEPAGPIVIDGFDITDAWCYTNSNGEIDITVSGGTQASPPPPYSYLWAGPSSFSSTSEDIINLGAGTYNVTAVDNNACAVSSSALVGTLAPINPGHYTWEGTTNNLWQISTNWDCGLPDQSAETIIPASPSGGILPLIQNGIIGDVLNIEIQGSTSDLLQIEPGGLLRVNQ
jgi:hypothetical protein